jgi:glycolate oxidase FAD binding subunit
MRPEREDEVRDAVADAIRRDEKLDIKGGGSKGAIGAPRPEAGVLDMTGLTGVIDYDPAELVLTVRPGTPLAEVEALLAGRGQMLAFDPYDHGPLFGGEAGRTTIGGVVAAGVNGSLRLSGGGVRDHLLGFRAVSGRAEAFAAGAKVVKNVTGYDLPKLAAGSWGRLFAMTELTLKVLPRPPVRATRAIEGLEPGEAVRLMAAVMGSQAEVGAAAYVPAALRSGRSLTALRILGFCPSVAARCEMVERLLAAHGAALALAEDEDAAFWQGMRALDALAGDAPLWRVNVPPSGGPAVVAALDPLGARWVLDWAGGLVWLAFDGDPALVRDAAARAGGHAMLVRAPEAMRATVPALQPPVAGVGALETRVRRAFDPEGVFETGRF